eukprot:TRINITY_DN9594_c0_g1_i1.p1 TRINITY_DN9594_c0_g1~~TRINITY_DN9594_c0_g1_i1.p1  ORF type:complete len:559 (+),score=163.12 TRINITY_DN9594_c0_g1_i1:17-1693(+)
MLNNLLKASHSTTRTLNTHSQLRTKFTKSKRVVSYQRSYRTSVLNQKNLDDLLKSRQLNADELFDRLDIDQNNDQELVNMFNKVKLLDENQFLFTEEGNMIFYKVADNHATYFTEEGKEMPSKEVIASSVFDVDGNEVKFNEKGVPIRYDAFDAPVSAKQVDESLRTLAMFDPNFEYIKDKYSFNEDVVIAKAKEAEQLGRGVRASLEAEEEEGNQNRGGIQFTNVDEKGRFESDIPREIVDGETGETIVLTDEDRAHAARMQKEHTEKMNSDLRIDGLKYRQIKAIENHDDPEDPYLQNYEDLIQPDVDRDVEEIKLLLQKLEQDREAKLPEGDLANFRKLLVDRQKPLRLRDIEYWALYPKKIRQWVMYTKSTRGYYNQWGRWVPVEDMTSVKFEKDEKTQKENWIKWQRVFETEQSKLPEELRNRYRFGVQPDEIESLHPKIKFLFSMSNASPRERTQVIKQDLIKKWKAHTTDTGSSEVQVAMLTLKIREAVEKVRKNRKEKSRIRVLQKFVSRRRSLMKKLKKKNVEKYYALLLDLNLGDIVQLYKNNPQEKR